MNHSVKDFELFNRKYLLRATDGKKEAWPGGKLQKSMFQIAYSNLLSAHMDELNKADRNRKGKKIKATQREALNLLIL